MLINELFSGQPIPEDQLREVLGHSPLEAAGGVVLGVAVALVVRLLWH
jgi:acid phosphatase family membrane protein YuiD